MEWTNVVLGGAAFGAVAGLWRQIRAVLWGLCNFLLQEVELREPLVAAAVAGHLVRRYRRIGPYTRIYTASSDHHVREGQQRFGIVAYERFGSQSLLFRRGPWPLLFQGSSGGTGAEIPSGGGQKASGGSGGASGRLIFIRGTVDVDRLIGEAVEAWNQVGWDLSEQGQGARRRFFIKYLPDVSRDKTPGGGPASSWQYYQNVRLLDLAPSDIGLGSHDRRKMLDRLFFPTEIEDLIEEVKTWRKSHDWYQSRGIPWKRGWLLYGKPGTGKTALASAFAQDLDLPIFVFNLAELGNLDFMAEWKSMLASAPCIALLEDLDAVFHGRDNISRREFSLDRQWDRLARGAARGGSARSSAGDGEEVDRGLGARPGYLSFDVLLNCIDGVDRAEGVFTIITTNHVEHIDPALGQPVRDDDGTIRFVSTRPGRIDRAVELSDMKPYVKRRMAMHLLGEFPVECEAMLRHIDAHPDEHETPAQFQQRCNQIALDCFWRTRRDATRPEANGAVPDDGPRPPELRSISGGRALGTGDDK